MQAHSVLTLINHIINNFNDIKQLCHKPDGLLVYVGIDLGCFWRKNQILTMSKDACI